MNNLKNLIAVCQHFANLGEAIGAQIQAVVDGTLDEDNFNTNAAPHIQEFLRKVGGLIPEAAGAAHEVMLRVDETVEEVEAFLLMDEDFGDEENEEDAKCPGYAEEVNDDQ